MSEIKDLVIQNEKEGKVVFASFEGIHAAEMNNFVSQPVEGILYDLNRLPEVVLTFIDDPKWVNDYAVQLVIKKLYSNWKAATDELSQFRARLEVEDKVWKDALNKIVKLGEEWDANKLGGVHFQIKRWQRLAEIAQSVLEAYRKTGSEAELRESGYGGEE